MLPQKPLLQTALPVSEDVERSLSFTLGTALCWLGHDCRGHCPAMVSECRASVWFLHLPDRMIATWNKTLVDVDFGDGWLPGDERRDLLRQVNSCVWSDNMRVRHRTAAERGAFFAALTARSSGPGRNQLQPWAGVTGLPLVIRPGQ